MGEAAGQQPYVFILKPFAFWHVKPTLYELVYSVIPLAAPEDS